jgi:CheY-like chemotaxis protein
MLGGEIGVAESGPQGSVFRFNVDAPAVEAPRDAAGAPSQIEKSHKLALLEGKRVLGIDDNAANRRILSATLAQWKLECHMVESASAAIEWLEAGGRADVAIVDMVMPGLDGLEFAVAVRKTPDVRDLPLVLLSSLGREEVVGPGAEEFQFILSKPLRRAPLLDSLLSIFFDSEEESGATRKASPMATEFDRSLATTRPLRILVAEDNKINQKLISHSLQRFGYLSDMTANGIECLEALKQRSYDLVLMDCQMPEMDGYETATRIRGGEAGDQNADVRIVALTAAAMLGDREKSIVAGMNDHLTKPVQPAQLKTVLRACTPVGVRARSPQSS